ncbi:hypothetical protein FRC00_014519 [Tulasnella sp. 408]|nr:hypothetical protein FRC00_014519 [Tulasnella sp. 408]
MLFAKACHATRWGKSLWGTDSDKAAVWQQMADVAGNFTGIPTMIGEFGLMDSGKINESASVWLWLDYVIRTARHFGFAMFLWDTGSFVDRTAGAWVDPTFGQVFKYAHMNDLRFRLTVKFGQPGNATVWIRQGDLIVDKTIGLRFSGNTLTGVYNGAGQALTSGTQYTASSTGVTLKASYLSSLVSGKPLGSIGTIVIKSNQGADLKIDIRYYKTPTVTTASYQSPITDYELPIPVTLNGSKLATVKAIKADGSILKDDWTIYLPEPQVGRLTWREFDYNEIDTLTVSTSILSLIKNAQQPVTLTFEFWPRYDSSNAVPITISYV